jgi:hypothetical protein
VDVTGYCKTVGTILAKLLLLMAVLLMPLGMSGAKAAQTARDAPRAMMAMGHCPDGAPSHHDRNGIAECTMACAGVLPAVDSAHDPSRMMAEEPIQPTIARQLRGLHPETATPPPKPS